MFNNMVTGDVYNNYQVTFVNKQQYITTWCLPVPQVAVGNESLQCKFVTISKLNLLIDTVMVVCV